MCICYNIAFGFSQSTSRKIPTEVTSRKACWYRCVTGIASKETSPSRKRMQYAEERQCEAEGDESGDKRERDVENRVDEIGCSCILTSWWEDCDEVRLPSSLSPNLFICLHPMQGGCLRHPLDSPEIQFTDGERVPDFARIKPRVLLRLAKLYSLNTYTQWRNLANANKKAERKY